MAGRSRNYDKEYDLLDKLKQENKQLKMQVQRLRKEIDKNRNNYEDIKDLLDQQAEEEIHIATKSKKKEDLLKRWQCHKCNQGVMKLIVLPRLDGPRYFRKCSACANKTTLKKYTEDVEGIVDEKDI